MILDGSDLSNEDKLYLMGKLVHFDDVVYDRSTELVERVFPDSRWDSE